MKVVLIPGDGIGKEISESVKKVSEVLKTNIEWETHSAGAEYYEKSGKLFDDDLMDAIQNTGIALKGPTATPIGTGFRSINVQLRQRFSTYANLRPVHSITGVKSRYENVDLVIVRENTEDLYKGIEYMYDANTAHGIKLITRSASERIARFAFEYARKHHRKKVTAVHKANIMKLCDGLFLESFKNVAKDYPEIESDSVIVDALCMKLVTDPAQFDVLVSENLMVILFLIFVRDLLVDLDLHQVLILVKMLLSMKQYMVLHPILREKIWQIQQLYCFLSVCF